MLQDRVSITPVAEHLETFALRLKDARKARGLSQAKLAHELGLRQSAIGNLEAGSREKPRDVLQMASALGVRAEWLLHGKGPRFETAQRLTDLHPDEVELLIRFRALRDPAAGRYLLAEVHRLARGGVPPTIETQELLAALDSLPDDRARRVAVQRSLRAVEGRAVPAANGDATPHAESPRPAPATAPGKRRARTRAKA